MEPTTIFLYFYFYHLELLLKESQDLQYIKFQSEEANIDEEIKIFLKKIITKNNHLPTLSIYRYLRFIYRWKESSI